MTPDFAAAQLAEARQMLEDVRAGLQNHALLPAWQRKIRAFLAYRPAAAPSPETGTAAVPRPLDKAAEWARMSGVDSRDPGPAPEPVKPPATCPEWMAKGKCELEAGHEGDVHTTRRGSYVWSVPRTPAAGTAPKGKERCLHDESHVRVCPCDKDCVCRDISTTCGVLRESAFDDNCLDLATQVKP